MSLLKWKRKRLCTHIIIRENGNFFSFPQLSYIPYIFYAILEKILMSSINGSVTKLHKHDFKGGKAFEIVALRVPGPSVNV